jgi:hypothetical protein
VTFVRLAVDKDSLYASEGPMTDANALSFAQVRMRENRQIRAHDTLDGLDFGVGNNGESVPSFAKDSSEASRLQDFDIAVLVHRMPEK